MALALAAGLVLALAGEARGAEPPLLTPLGIMVQGGSEWRRQNDFEVRWVNPPGFQVVGASWRIYSSATYDSGQQFAPGLGLNALHGVRLPAAGEYWLQVWQRDASGFEASWLSAEVKLRLDDVAPFVAFLPGAGAPAPQVVALVADGLSGVVEGTISYRRGGEAGWSDLETRLVAGALGLELSAAMPPLEPGISYEFRAEARDAAGNVAVTTQRADGAPMRLEAPGAPARPGSSGEAGGRRPLRIRARLRSARGAGSRLTVDAGERVLLTGRLLDERGGVAGRRLRVVSRPARGARGGRTVARVVSGPRGGFRLPLGPGPSRRIVVAAGAGDSAVRRQLTLRVRTAVSLRAARSRLRTGEVLRLSGRVGHRGARLPGPGKLVTISYRERETGRWRPVLFTRTDRAGRFHARYRFRYIRGRARIRLRAAAPAEAAWPYAPGHSRPLTVEVRG